MKRGSQRAFNVVGDSITRRLPGATRCRLVTNISKHTSQHLQKGKHASSQCVPSSLCGHQLFSFNEESFLGEGGFDLSDSNVTDCNLNDA